MCLVVWNFVMSFQLWDMLDMLPVWKFVGFNGLDSAGAGLTDSLKGLTASEVSSHGSLTGLLSTYMCPVTEHLKSVPESHCSVINCWELVDNLPYQPIERKVWLKQCHKMHVACLNSGLAVSRSRALRIGEFFFQRLICELIDLSGPHNQSSWDCGLWFELSFSDSFSG